MSWCHDISPRIPKPHKVWGQCHLPRAMARTLRFREIFWEKTGVKIEVERITYLPAAKRYMFVPFTKHSSPPGTSLLRHRWKRLEKDGISETQFCGVYLGGETSTIFWKNSPLPREDGSILTVAYVSNELVQPPTRYNGFFFWIQFPFGDTLSPIHGSKKWLYLKGQHYLEDLRVSKYVATPVYKP